jgi:hypothetical protein
MPKKRSAGSGAAANDADFEQYLNASALEVARRYGDWDYLAIYLEDGGFISDEMRAFLAAVLRGEKKRPPNRAQTAMNHARHKLLAMAVLNHKSKGKNTEAAINAVCEHNNVDRRTVQRALKTWRPRLQQALSSGEAEKPKTFVFKVLP